MDSNPKPRRRWFRYSLRTLLLLVTICCALFAWLGLKFQEARDQQAAVEVIQQMGGEVSYADEFPGGFFDPWPKVPGPAWMRRWLGDDFFRTANCVSRSPLYPTRRPKYWNATDADLAWLDRLPHLEWLNLSSTQITDAGLVHLQKFDQLKMLDLTGTRVTDRGCEELRKALPNLKIIR